MALVVEWLDAWRGGAETSTLQFLHHLMDRGVEVHLFTRSRPSPAPNVHVHTIRGAAMSRIRQSVTFTHRVDWMLGRESFDVIHAISPCRKADIYQPRGGTVAEAMERNIALLKARPLRRLKRYANHFNFKQRYTLGLERALLGNHDGPMVVAISDYVVDQLRRHYSVWPERIRKIYNGVDPDPTPDAERQAHRAAIRREYGIAEADLLVLSIAHNFRLKGLRHWMDAMALLATRGVDNVRSLVIGKGENEHWHRLAAKHGIADRLTFTGPSERVRQFHHAADLLVHPTYYDPCSRVVLEAMVAGLPCITTRWDGASEMIEDGVNGFVLDEPRDVTALAEHVAALRDRDCRQGMAAHACQIADRVSMARHADGILELYERLAAERRS
ncbi:MAG: glycosyltransferase family 4 protein [Phycisphaerae bacterium]